MTAMRTQAPTLVWLLTALSCLLVGMTIVETQDQFVAPPILSPIGLVETSEVAYPPTGTPVPTPTTTLDPEETPASPLSLHFEDIPIPHSADPMVLRAVRLIVPPETLLPLEETSGPSALLIESGTLSIQVDNLVYVGQGYRLPQTVAALSAGERIVLDSGARYAVRNNGSTPAVALVVAIPPGTPTT